MYTNYSTCSISIVVCRGKRENKYRRNWSMLLESGFQTCSYRFVWYWLAYDEEILIVESVSYDKLCHLIFWIKSWVDIFYCSSNVTSNELTTAGSTKYSFSQYRSTLVQLFLARSMFNISICCHEWRQVASARQGSVWWKKEWAHKGIKSFSCQGNQESNVFMPYCE